MLRFLSIMLVGYGACATLAASQPLKIEKDVHVTRSKSFYLPVILDPATRNTYKQFRIFASKDLGKTWQLVTAVGNDQTRVRYDAANDGTYWFALQLVFRDGSMDPSSELELTACKKIVVDTAGRIDQTESNELSNRNQQLELELQALREAIMRLEKRVSELESRPDASQSSVRARYARPLRFGRR